MTLVSGMEASYAAIWGKSLLGRGKSKCQGQEAREPARKPESPEHREGESGGDKVEMEMGASSDGIS